MSRPALAMVLCGLAMSTAAHAQPVALRVAAQEGTEPKFIADGKGGATGFCMDLFRAIENSAPGLSFALDKQWLPPPRANQKLATRQHDAICAVQRTAERERRYVFLDLPLYTMQYKLVVRADDDVAVRDWNDVRNLGIHGVVLANRGYTTAEMLEQLGGLMIDAAATNPARNLQKLLAGRARFFMHHAQGLQHVIAHGEAAGKVKILPQIMYARQAYLALGSHIEPPVQHRIERALKQIEQNGELARLRERWGLNLQ